MKLSPTQKNLFLIGLKILNQILKKKDFYKIYIDYPRDELIKRINIRTEEMIKNGAVLEVKKFIRLKVPMSKTASKAIGIKEIRNYLNKKSKKRK